MFPDGGLRSSLVRAANLPPYFTKTQITDLGILSHHNACVLLPISYIWTVLVHARDKLST
jgi:hypothetical protein